MIKYSKQSLTIMMQKRILKKYIMMQKKNILKKYIMMLKKYIKKIYNDDKKIY